MTVTPRLEPEHLDEPEDLDDEADRQELRDRSYGLMQELRVIRPGSQVLVAFLFTGLASSLFVVTRFVFTDSTAVLLTGVTVVAMLALWLALPLASRVG